ncbi:MAG: nucleoside kinase [Clostridia bacterium]|nr:nucleoside kinase [Clostridia bacterium]
MIKITYKNKIINTEKVKVSTLLKNEIAQKNAIACRFNNEVKSLDFEINENGTIQLIDIKDKDGMRIYRRGLVYILTKAFESLYPNAKTEINFQLSNSMLCEVIDAEVNDEMIQNINKKFKEIVDSDLPIIKKRMSKKEAKEFYNKEKNEKGRLQIEDGYKDKVSLYYCEDYYNYFYGVLPISTGFAKLYEIVKYHNGILIRYPNRNDITKLPNFEENKKLLETLDEYESLHETLHIQTLYKLNRVIKKNKIKEYILLDEALHEKKLASIADDIVKRKKVKVILIAGPSSSGKTTFAQRLGIQLRLNGLKPVTMSVDNYFVERKDNPKDADGNYDFECIEAIDTKLFNDHILKLLNGEEIDVPTFDFEEGTKKYNGEKMRLKDDQILVIEGIHCLNDRLTTLIPKEQKYKIYISCLTVLNLDFNNRISTTDSRLIRRIVRDNQFRGYSALHTLKMWDSVNRGEERNIFPYQEQADSMFNSSLIYEIAVLKDYAIPLLKEIDNSHPEYSEAKKLLSMLEYFNSVPAEYVPTNSLLREFIGGSIFHEK